MMGTDKIKAVNSVTLRAQAEIDKKTKPIGSLGQIESLAVQISTVQQTLSPQVDPARIVVFGADHGVASEGVSAYPSEVTAQMMGNFAAGGAAVCVMGKVAGATVEAVDVGVNADLSDIDGIIHDKVAPGTANLAQQAAMTHEQLDLALQVGREAVVRAVQSGTRCLGLGEMGIGNTTSAAIITGLLTNSTAEQVTGRGTGLSDARLPDKVRVVAEAMHRLQDVSDDPMECLRQAGGLEIAALVGAMMEAPAHKLVVIVDGFIVTAAALIACRLRPAAKQGMIFAHQSAETGHRLALHELDSKPLLDLGMRLGEGSACALVLPLLRAACAVMNDMASFADAGVSTEQI